MLRGPLEYASRFVNIRKTTCSVSNTTRRIAYRYLPTKDVFDGRDQLTYGYTAASSQIDDAARFTGSLEHFVKPFHRTNMCQGKIPHVDVVA